jgi:hypothetical protein
MTHLITSYVAALATLGGLATGLSLGTMVGAGPLFQLVTGVVGAACLAPVVVAFALKLPATIPNA